MSMQGPSWSLPVHMCRTVAWRNPFWLLMLVFPRSKKIVLFNADFRIYETTVPLKTVFHYIIRIIASSSLLLSFNTCREETSPSVICGFLGSMFLIWLIFLTVWCTHAFYHCDRSSLHFSDFFIFFPKHGIRN